MNFSLKSKLFRWLGLGVALVIITGIIWYLDSGKANTGVVALDLPGSQIPIATSTLAVPEDIAAAVKTASSTGATTSPAVTSVVNAAMERIKEKAAQYPRAKEIVNPAGFINTSTTTIRSLIGKKVILLDFWTYSCINCLRTLPYVTAWSDKYKDDGLVVIGMHTPEFDFEKDYANVLRAVNMYGIKYPVVLDNSYSTWTAYGNQYWPREYLIDIDGFIVHDQIGEGNYDETERAIQSALSERAQVLGLSVNVPTGLVTPKNVEVATMPDMTPETYFGSARNEYFGNGIPAQEGDQAMNVPTNPEPGAFYLGGAWHFEPEYATNESKAKIVYPINAQKVFFVASSEQGTTTIRVLLDGKPLTAEERGSDVGPDSTAEIKDQRLYRLIEDTGAAGTHTVEIDIDSPGLDAYTFTFG